MRSPVTLAAVLAVATLALTGCSAGAPDAAAPAASGVRRRRPSP